MVKQQDAEVVYPTLVGSAVVQIKIQTKAIHRIFVVVDVVAAASEQVYLI